MVMRLELFSAPNCNRCGRAKRVVADVVNELGTDRISVRVVNVVEEIDYAVKLGVIATPAIAVDGTLAFTGLPNARALYNALSARLAAHKDDSCA